MGSKFLDRLSHKSSTLIAQGPMGTMLMSQLNAKDVPPSYWNIGEPITVEYLHRMYCYAGAEVMITNSFQANARNLKEDDVFASVSEVCTFAVRNALIQEGTYVLGSIGPVRGFDLTYREDTLEYREARQLYREQAYALLNAGAHGILLETFTSINQIAPALQGVQDVSEGMPILVSFAVDSNGNLVGDGLSIEGAVVWTEKRKVASVGINCCPLDTAMLVVPRLIDTATVPISVRPNAGKPFMNKEGELVWSNIDDELKEAAVVWKSLGVTLIGSCCGTTPVTTSIIAEALQ